MKWKRYFQNFQCVNNANLMIEDFLGFLFSQLSAQVPIGSHYLYMRPLLNPMGAIKYNKVHKKSKLWRFGRYSTNGC